MNAVSLFCALAVVLSCAVGGQAVADTPVKPVADISGADLGEESYGLTQQPDPQPESLLVPATVATAFEEVEVLLDGTISLEAIAALPQAPEGPFELLTDPARVVVQLPTDVVRGLVKQGANVRTLRSFVLVEPADRTDADGGVAAPAACSGDYRNGSNGANVAIPDYDGWVYSAISITGAPSNAVVNCIDVHYQIIHTWAADLDVDLNDQNLTYNYDLWEPGDGWGEEDINETVTSIVTFNGEAVNQLWGLYARDTSPWDEGYIDTWWIKVYYSATTTKPDLVIDTSSRTPATGVTPGGTVNLADTIANRGNAAAPAGFRAMWYISVDANVNTFDRAWAYRNVPCCLAVGGTTPASGGIPWPNVAPYNTPGQTYYVAVMADDTGAVSESNEANNWGQVWTVTLEACNPPPTPSGPAPPDDATNVPPDVELCWNTSAAIAKLIYGPDDRMDVCEVADPGLLDAADSTVALVDTSILNDNGDGTYSLPSTPTLRDYIEWLTRPYYYPPCPGERFVNQPIPAFCSGALVAPDLVVTAGHCIVNATDCAATAFVFGFDMEGTPPSCGPVLTFPTADVYFCNAIVERVQVNGGPDWGVIRLDRPVTGHVPLPVRRAGKVADAQPLVMIGHPVGLPTKIADGATTWVRDNTPPGHFLTNVDAYGGNSGSAVINATTGFPMIEGLLVWGNPDWRLGATGDCTESNRCPDTGCTDTSSHWEGVTRATEFAHLVPWYDVYLGPCGAMSLVHTGPETCWSPPILQTHTEYCWQVIAKDSCGESPGPIWSFTTGRCVDAADPPNCAIDARQPSQPNGSNPAGWDATALTFSAGCDVAGITPASFSVREVPAPGSPNSVCSVQKSGNVVTVRLCRRISLQTWTCVAYNPTGEEVCLGHLPADVNNDGCATPVDILATIDNLNGQVQPPYPIWQCDVDRSGVCAPADILRVIDLLNGADVYDPWLGRTLPVCPSAP
jgi:hypothetical protein